MLPSSTFLSAFRDFMLLYSLSSRGYVVQYIVKGVSNVIIGLIRTFFALFCRFPVDVGGALAAARSVDRAVTDTVQPSQSRGDHPSTGTVKAWRMLVAGPGMIPGDDFMMDHGPHFSRPIMPASSSTPGPFDIGPTGLL